MRYLLVFIMIIFCSCICNNNKIDSRILPGVCFHTEGDMGSPPEYIRKVSTIGRDGYTSCQGDAQYGWYACTSPTTWEYHRIVRAELLIIITCPTSGNYK